MNFSSILFLRDEDNHHKEPQREPDFFTDLNLNQVVDAITAYRQEYDLRPFFYLPLTDIDAIHYRHEIMRDLEDEALFNSIEAFARRMRVMRDYLAQSNKLYYQYQKERWFLDAVEIYCEAINSLAQDLARLKLKSRGFQAFYQYLLGYISSERFGVLLQETKKLKSDLSEIRYSLHIKENRIKVQKFDDEIDYSQEVENIYDKFKQGAVKDYLVQFSEWPDMNHIEAKILDLVALLFPQPFTDLDQFYSKNSHYLDELIAVFDREVQFYIAYLEYINAFRRQKLSFCYPIITDQSKEVYDYEGFDLALASKLSQEKQAIVCNDFYLRDQERIFVVSGPNQGGKTTFARVFGQLHYLASLGCPVPGRQAQLYLFDRLFTHFEKVENVENLHGKLQDDLIRIYDILSQATPNSIVIINEIFTSTTLEDAIYLGKKVMGKIIQLDLLCVYVTFIDELSVMHEKIVSVVSTVRPDNPAVRTYKIVRKAADGLSYAMTIAEKYHLTYASLKERIRS